MEPLTTAPAVSDFTPLSEHQEQTPGTFFDGKPVLHLYAQSSTIKAPNDQYEAQPDLKQLGGDNSATIREDGQINISNVDVWVTSKHLILFSPVNSTGLQIPYPTITVTAQDGSDVLLELNLSDDDTADEEILFLQLRITPTHVSHHATEQAATGSSSSTNGTTSHNDSATALFKAISDCQELNPDPLGMGDEDEEGDGDFDETAPGATGWITSENMAEFIDENGNFRMPEGLTVVGGEGDDDVELVEQGEGQEALGEGAGRTRSAAEALEEEESKWRRTG